MVKHLTLFLFAFIIPLILSAQDNYKNGYVVSIQGDTLKGYINYREWHNNPGIISFKSTLTDKTQSFTPTNSKSFGVDGYELYEAFKVSISLDELNAKGINKQNDTLLLASTVFLKKILKGNLINVYRYKDKIKERYYILEGGNAVPVELRNQIYLNEGNIITPLFQQQLSALAIKHSKFILSQQIHSISYSKTDLINIIKQINTDNITNFSKTFEKKQKARFFFGPGFSYGTIIYRGENLITVDRKNSNGFDKFRDKVVTQYYLPKFAVGADIFIKPEVRRTILRGEFSVTSMKSEVVSYLKYNSISDREQRNTYNLSITVFSAIPQVIYNLYNKENFKIYLATGAAYSYYLTNQNILNRTPTDKPDSEPDEIIHDYVGIKKMGLNVLLRAGVVVLNKVEVGITYMNPTETSNYISSKGGSVKATNLQLSFNYFLNKK